VDRDAFTQLGDVADDANLTAAGVAVEALQDGKSVVEIPLREGAEALVDEERLDVQAVVIQLRES
jgi:hypothetical protein